MRSKTRNVIGTRVSTLIASMSGRSAPGLAGGLRGSSLPGVHAAVPIVTARARWGDDGLCLGSEPPSAYQASQVRVGDFGLEAPKLLAYNSGVGFCGRFPSPLREVETTPYCFSSRNYRNYLPPTFAGIPPTASAEGQAVGCQKEPPFVGDFWAHKSTNPSCTPQGVGDAVCWRAQPNRSSGLCSLSAGAAAGERCETPNLTFDAAENIISLMKNELSKR